MQQADFVPVYDDSVREVLKDDPQHREPQSISQYYCLMPASARILSTFFEPTPVIFMAAPTPQADGSPFAFNHLVPWLRFAQPGGQAIERNAGQLAHYVGMPGVSDWLAEAKLDVNTPVEGQ